MKQQTQAPWRRWSKRKQHRPICLETNADLWAMFCPFVARAQGLIASGHINEAMKYRLGFIFKDRTWLQRASESVATRHGLLVWQAESAIVEFFLWAPAEVEFIAAKRPCWI